MYPVTYAAADAGQTEVIFYYETRYIIKKLRFTYLLITYTHQLAELFHEK